MTITEILSEFIVNLDVSELPETVINKAKNHLLDQIGVSLGASGSEPVSQAIASLLPDMRTGGSPIWGRDIKVSLLPSILINGIMSHLLELDDVHREAKAHMGPVVIPVALNLGAYLHCSGEKLLGAIIAGYEVMIRIAKGVGPSSHRYKGWHATGTCGTFGAAAAASYLFGLDVSQTVNALGLAGTQSAGLWAFIHDGSLSKRLHCGRSAESGVLAALMAKQGFTGPKMIIEAEDGGFFKATSDAYDFKSVTEGIGKTFEILGTGMKPYACCRTMHPAINAILLLRDKVRLDEVERIEIRIFSVGKFQCDKTKHPSNPVEAQFSLAYAVSVALLDGQVLPEQFLPDRVKDPEARRLADLVEVVPCKAYDEEYPSKWQTEVIVRTKSGEKFRQFIPYAKGEPENPLSEWEIREKFIVLSGTVLSSEKQESIINFIKEVNVLSDVEVLVRLLS